MVWYTFELIQNFIIAIKDIKRTTLFNFMVHTVWFYGQCCAKKEFLVEVSEQNLEFARNTFFNCLNVSRFKLVLYVMRKMQM